MRVTSSHRLRAHLSKRGTLFLASCIVFVLLLAGSFTSGIRADLTTNPKNVSPIPRASFVGLHIGLSEDSVKIIFRSRAKRQQISHVDSLDLIESDSIIVFGQPAYVQAQILHGRVRTLVINFHPLAGERYLNVRDLVDHYLQSLFGRGVEESADSMTHHRWETIDGTMEVTHSDKYTRVFIRLGKPRV